LPDPTTAYAFDSWYAAGGTDKILELIKYLEQDQLATLDYLKKKYEQKEEPPV